MTFMNLPGVVPAGCVRQDPPAWRLGGSCAAPWSANFLWRDSVRPAIAEDATTDKVSRCFAGYPAGQAGRLNERPSPGHHTSEGLSE